MEKYTIENTPTLKTKRLTLRKFTENDAQDVFGIYSDVEVNKFLPWLPFCNIDEAKAHIINKIFPQYLKDVAYCYAVELNETNSVIGYVHINDIGRANDMGYGMAKKYWNMGYTSEAVQEVVNHLKKVKFPYLTATHDILNPFSGEVMKKVGMTYRYTYEELWQPKNYIVNFRMYQLNLDGNESRLITKYWDNSAPHFIENISSN